MLIVKAMLHRLSVATVALRRDSPSEDRALVEVINARLPDLKELLKVRPAVFAAYVAARNAAQCPEPPKAAQIAVPIEDDIELNLELDTGVDVTPAPAMATSAAVVIQAAHLSTVAMLDCLTWMCQLSPSCAAAMRFDLPKLLDDMFPENCAFVLDDSDASDSAVFAALMSLLHEMQKMFGWFGKDEENVKLLHHFILKDWADENAAFKRFALVKLHQRYKQASYSERIRELMHSILTEASGLFIGHGQADFDLSSEASSWLFAAQQNDDMLVLESVLRLSMTWNIELCENGEKLLRTVYPNCCIAPFSPVLFCTMCLLAGHWEAFAERMGTTMRFYMLSEGKEMDYDHRKTAEQKAVYFTKLQLGLLKHMEPLLLNTLLRQCCSVRDSKQYLEVVVSFAHAIPASFASFERIRGFVKQLRSVFTISATVSKGDAPKRVSVAAMVQRAEDCTALVAIVANNLDASLILIKSKHNGKDCAESNRVKLLLDHHWPFFSTAYLVRIKAGVMPVTVDTLTWILTKWMGADMKSALRIRSAWLPVLLYQLHLLDGIIHNNISHKRSQEQQATECFILSDFLCGIVLQLYADLSEEREDFVLQAADMPMLLSSFMLSNAFGMICRRILKGLLPVFGAAGAKCSSNLIKTEQLLSTLSSKLVQEWQPANVMTDPSYLELASALSFDEAAGKLYVDTRLQDLRSVLKEVCITMNSSSTLISVSPEILKLMQGMSLTQRSQIAQRYIWMIHSNSEDDANKLPVGNMLSILMPMISYNGQDLSMSSAFDGVDLTADLQAAMDIVATNTTASGLQLLGVICALLDQHNSVLLQGISSERPADRCTQAEYMMSLLALPPLPPLSSRSAIPAQLKVAAWLLDAIPLPALKDPLDKVLQYIISVQPTQAHELLACILRDAAQQYEGCLQGTLLYQILQTLLLEEETASVRSFQLTFIAVLEFYLLRSTEAFKDTAGGYIVQMRRVTAVLSQSMPMTESMLTTVRGALDKWVKLGLKNRFESVDLHSELFRFFQLQRSLGKHSELLDPSAASFCHPVTALTMLTTHTKCNVIIQSPDPGVVDLKVALLRTVLLLCNVVFSTENDDQIDGILSSLSGLVQVLSSAYNGSVALADRIILRILILLRAADRSLTNEADLLLLRPKAAAMSSMHAWLMHHIKPAKVYASIANFPIHRRLVAVRFHWEDHCPQQKRLDNWLAAVCGSIHSEELSEETLLQVDVGEPASPDVYDPSYYLPLILHTLHTETAPVKGLLNSGMVSYVIICLSSHCKAVRTLALSALELFWKLLHSDAVEEDKMFKERIQIKLLISFIRNAIDNNNAAMSGKKSSIILLASPLPCSAGIFLSRAAMNLMLSLHQLYGKTNRYLINRKFLDIKDVPLFDLLLLQSETMDEKVQLLRMLRDGLRSHADHLNLCRKHAYNKLLMLFHVHFNCEDARFGQALLDVIGQALCIHEAANYLLDKCNLLPWLSHTVQVCITKLRDSSAEVRTSHSMAGQYVLRCLHLVRKACSAVYLLHLHSAAHSEPMVNQLSNTLRGLLLLADHMSADLLAALQTATWDHAILCKAIGAPGMEWPALHAFAAAVMTSEGTSLTVRLSAYLLLGMPDSEGNELQSGQMFDQVVKLTLRFVSKHFGSSEEVPEQAVLHISSQPFACPPSPHGDDLCLANSIFLVKSLHMLRGEQVVDPWPLMGAVGAAEVSWLTNALSSPQGLGIVLACAARAVRPLRSFLSQIPIWKAWHRFAFACTGLQAAGTGTEAAGDDLFHLQQLLSGEERDILLTAQQDIAINLDDGMKVALSMPSKEARALLRVFMRCTTSSGVGSALHTQLVVDMERRLGALSASNVLEVGRADREEEPVLRLPRKRSRGATAPTKRRRLLLAL